MELARQRSQRGRDFTDCIVLNSCFRSPLRGGGAWRASAIYTWHWFILKEADGDWFLLDYGYP